MNNSKNLTASVRDWMQQTVRIGHGRYICPLGTSPSTVYQYMLKMRADYPGYVFRISRKERQIDIEVLSSRAPEKVLDRLLDDFGYTARMALAADTLSSEKKARVAEMNKLFGKVMQCIEPSIVVSDGNELV